MTWSAYLYSRLYRILSVCTSLPGHYVKTVKDLSFKHGTEVVPSVLSARGFIIVWWLLLMTWSQMFLFYDMLPQETCLKVDSALKWCLVWQVGWKLPIRVGKVHDLQLMMSVILVTTGAQPVCCPRMPTAYLIQVTVLYCYKGVISLRRGATDSEGNNYSGWIYK